MSLSVLIAGETVTGTASNIQIRSTTTGYASVSFNLNRKLDDSLLAPFTDVLVYDTATGEQVGGGRLMEQGRNDDGTWSITCLGEGLASMQDRTTPWFAIDSSLENWRVRGRDNSRFTAGMAAPPAAPEVGIQTMMATATPEGRTIPPGIRASMDYVVGDLTKQNIGSIRWSQMAGAADSDWRLRLYLGLAGNTGFALINDTAWGTTYSTSYVEWTPSTFGSNRYTALFEWARASTTHTITDTSWCAVWFPIVRAQLMDRNRALTSAGVTNPYVTIDQVFIDWIARYAPRLDAPNASITAGTHQFTQLVYLDGVDGMALFDDLGASEPDFVWAVWEKNDSGQWQTELKRLPSTVRYEASVEDGFNSPTPSTEIYNRATVMGRDSSGNYRRTNASQSVPALDDVGLIREDTTPVNASSWSAAAASATAAAFLANRKVPPNAGTLTIARPIQDYTTGRWIRPAHIRPGELIRVRGVQPTPDTLNATSPDGVTVFRVMAMTYSDDTGAATLELDSLKLTQQRAIAQSYQLWTYQPKKAVKNPKFGTRNPLR